MTLDAFDGPGHAEEDLKLLDQIEELFNTIGDSSGRAARLDHMRAALKYLYTRECAPYLKGDEVVITKTPTAVDAPGWAAVLHLLQPGTRATVESVRVFSNGWSIGVKVADVVGVYCFKPDALKAADAEPPVEEPAPKRLPRIHAHLFRKRLPGAKARSQYALTAIPTAVTAHVDLRDLLPMECDESAANNAWDFLCEAADACGGVGLFVENVADASYTPPVHWLPDLIFVADSVASPQKALAMMLHMATDKRSVVAGIYNSHTDVEVTLVDLDTIELSNIVPEV